MYPTWTHSSNWPLNFARLHFIFWKVVRLLDIPMVGLYRVLSISLAPFNDLESALQRLNTLKQLVHRYHYYFSANLNILVTVRVPCTFSSSPFLISVSRSITIDLGIVRRVRKVKPTAFTSCSLGDLVLLQDGSNNRRSQLFRNVTFFGIMMIVNWSPSLTSASNNSKTNAEESNWLGTSK